MKEDKFYIRNNKSRKFVMEMNQKPKSFSSQRASKRYADQHLKRFTIISYNSETETMKWRGGERG